MTLPSLRWSTGPECRRIQLQVPDCPSWLFLNEDSRDENNRKGWTLKNGVEICTTMPLSLCRTEIHVPYSSFLEKLCSQQQRNLQRLHFCSELAVFQKHNPIVWRTESFRTLPMWTPHFPFLQGDQIHGSIPRAQVSSQLPTCSPVSQPNPAPGFCWSRGQPWANHSPSPKDVSASCQNLGIQMIKDSSAN